MLITYGFCAEISKSCFLLGLITIKKNVHSNRCEVSDNLVNVAYNATTVTVVEFFSYSRLKSGEAGGAEVKMFLGGS